MRGVYKCDELVGRYAAPALLALYYCDAASRMPYLDGNLYVLIVMKFDVVDFIPLHSREWSIATPTADYFSFIDHTPIISSGSPFLFFSYEFYFGTVSGWPKNPLFSSRSSRLF
jgi:hypothetical protein